MPITLTEEYISLRLTEAIEANREYVTAETLTVELTFNKIPDPSMVLEDEFDGEKVTIRMAKA